MFLECDSYKYDTTWYGTTIPSEKGWVCDKEINVANIFAYSKIGEAFGSIFFGWFGDVWVFNLKKFILINNNN